MPISEQTLFEECEALMASFRDQKGSDICPTTWTEEEGRAFFSDQENQGSTSRVLSGQLKRTSGECWMASEGSVHVFCPFLFRLFVFLLSFWGASQVVLAVKNPPANAREVRDTGSIPG